MAYITKSSRSKVRPSIGTLTPYSTSATDAAARTQEAFARRSTRKLRLQSHKQRTKYIPSKADPRRRCSTADRCLPHMGAVTEDMNGTKSENDRSTTDSLTRAIRVPRTALGRDGPEPYLLIFTAFGSLISDRQSRVESVAQLHPLLLTPTFSPFRLNVFDPIVWAGGQ